LRASSRTLRVAALVLTALGCSPRTIVVVEPCPDGGATSCGRGLLDDLIGYWRFDDPPASTTARDWSGWGNNGRLVGLDPATAWVPGGPEGGALSLQGKGHVVVAPSTSIDSITDRVTVAAWILLQGPATEFATAISRQIGGGYGQVYHLSVTSNAQAALFITPSVSGQVVMYGPMNVPQQTWVHIAATYDGSRVHLYLNGTPLGSSPATGSFAAETNPVIIGGNANAGDHAVSELVPGLLDEVMLYRRALADDEIARLAMGALLSAPQATPDAGP
jgi:hypothetical protein